MNKLITASLIAGALLFDQSARAAQSIWANTGTDYNTAGNWSAGIPTGNNNAAFTAAEITQPNLSASVSISGLVFTTTTASGYDITNSSSSAFTLTGQTSGSTAQSTNSDSAAIFAANTSGTNTFDVNLILAPASGTTSTFNQATGGTLVVNGVVSGSGITLNLPGAGTVQLNGVNTYTGGTSLNSGRLQIGNDSALGSGTLTLGNSTATIIQATGGAHTIANNVVWGGSGTISGTNSLTVNGSFTSSGSATRGLTVNNNTTLAGNVFLAATDVVGGLVITGSGALTISGVITNNSGANLATSTLRLNSATETLTLTGTNTYTGATNLSAGTLSLGNKAAFGTSTVGWNGVTTSASIDLSGANAIANAGTLGDNNIFTGSNNIELSGSLSQSSSHNITNNISGGTLTLSGGLALSTGPTSFNATFNGSGNTVISGVVSNGGTATASTLTYSGSNKLTLTNTNTYGGATTISGGGTISAGTIGNSGSSGNIGAGTTINFGSSGTSSGTLLYTGTGETSTKVINLNGSTGGATIDQSGTGLLKFSSDFTATTNGAKTVTLQGSSAGTGEIAGKIIDSTNPTSLTKAGSGTWTLSGANTYTGATTISAGTLLVNGNQSSATGAVSVTGTLGGIGTIGGTTTINAGGTIAPGASIGTLSLNNKNLIVSTSGTYLVDIGGTASDLLALGTGVLDLGAVGDIISFNVTGALTGISYTLATYASVNGTFDTVTALPGGYQLDYTGNALLLDQITAVPEPSTWFVGALVFASLLVSQRKRFIRKTARAEAVESS